MLQRDARAAAERLEHGQPAQRRGRQHHGGRRLGAYRAALHTLLALLLAFPLLAAL